MFSSSQIDPVMLTKSEPYLFQIETCGSAYVLVHEMFTHCFWQALLICKTPDFWIYSMNGCVPPE